MATLLLAGCDSAPKDHPVTTAAEALSIAHDRLRGTPAGQGPFRVTQDDSGGWIVISGPPSAMTAVMIDRRTGKATTGFYQVVHINESLK